MYQKLIIVGNLGREPELRFSDKAEAVCTFSVAVGRKVKGEDQTAWYRVTVWGNQAEPCSKYLTKGSKVLVEGQLQFDKATGGPRVWEDKDGNSRASFEVFASQVVFLNSKQDAPDDGDPF